MIRLSVIDRRVSWDCARRNVFNIISEIFSGNPWFIRQTKDIEENSVRPKYFLCWKMRIRSQNIDHSTTRCFATKWSNHKFVWFRISLSAHILRSCGRNHERFLEESRSNQSEGIQAEKRKTGCREACRAFLSSQAPSHVEGSRRSRKRFDSFVAKGSALIPGSQPGTVCPRAYANVL